eukprot:4674629-Amphidinium_carterae.1
MSTFEHLVVEAAKVSASLSQAEVRNLYRIAEEGKLFLKTWVDNCLCNDPASPVLYQYRLDTTPLKVRTFYDSGVGKKQSGMMPADYLVQVLAVTIGGEVPKHMVYFNEAILVEDGKSNRALGGIA